jgi:Beta-propeller repeat/Abnormal spindle-like microcephaly-assoc'd, ASPM-SPD-2-Hydin
MRNFPLAAGSLCAVIVAVTMAFGLAGRKLEIRPMGGVTSAPPQGPTVSDARTRRLKADLSPERAQSYGRLPIAFEPNKGQTTQPAKFLARGNGYAFFVQSGGIQLALRRAASGHAGTWISPDGKSAEHGFGSHANRQFRDAAVWGALQFQLVGGSSTPQFTALEELPGKSNYFIGSDPSRWRTNIPTYRKIAERGVYPGIDLIYYGTQRQLEYDFVVAPDADPATIRLALRGAEQLSIDDSGNLVIELTGGSVRLKRPVAYQATANGKQFVASNYVLEGPHTVAFRLGRFDHSRALVIDPILSYSTYLGGSNIDGANAIAVASDNTAFITGGTFSTDFPLANPLQGASAGNEDAFVSKISADGSAFLYSTYLGGGNDDVGNGIAVDTFGNAYVTGTTFSPDFPVTQLVFNPECGGDGKCGATLNPQDFIVSNAFVTKLNPLGTGLIYSGFLGEYEDVTGQAIAVDANQIAYVTGEVTPNLVPTVTITPPNVPPPPFPITANAAQATIGGLTDAYVTAISATGSAILYSTYVGGSNEEIGYGIAVDTATNAYITGLTYSSNFPVTASAYQGTYGGNGDAFLAKVNTTAGGAFLYSTYLGGSGLDQGNGIAVDTNGNAYIGGEISSPGFPSPLAYGGEGDAFVAKFNPSLSGASSLAYFTYLGGSLADSANSIAVDSAFDAYVTGSTVSTNFPVAAGAFQPQYGGGDADAFVTELDPTGTVLLYSSYLGGTNTDIGYGIATDSTSATTGSAYVVGQTCSEDFPLANPLQAAPDGNCDAFVSKVEVLAGFELNPAGLVFTGQSLGTTSQPQTVTLTNGDAAQTISSILITGTNPGDFAETNNCGKSLAPAAQCTISVTFTPAAAGIRQAQVTLTDSAPGSPQVLDLTGTTSTLTLSASNLDFGVQHAGVASSPLAVTATNDGTVAVSFSSIVASGAFSETDDCTKAALQPTTNCTINVTFTPSSVGTSVGALTLTDNAPGSPQVILLTGVGFGAASDFTLSVQPTSASVPAGQSAKYAVTLGSIGGFAQPVSFSCSGLPANSSCLASANPATPTATGTTVSVAVATTARTLTPVNRPSRMEPPNVLRILGAIWVLLAMSVLVFSVGARRGPRVAAVSVLVLVTAMMLFSAACGGGTQVGAPVGTPAGTYQVSIVGTSGSLEHAATVTLQVN